MRKMLKPFVVVVCLSIVLTPALYAGTYNPPRKSFQSFLAEHIMDFAAIFHFIPPVDVPRDQQLPISDIDVWVAGGLNVNRLGDGD